jgi:excisionase family DNA binding protein
VCLNGFSARPTIESVEPEVGAIRKNENLNDSAGWTGLEPAASGVTGGPGGVAGGSKGVQAVEIIRSRLTPRIGKSQRLAPILDDLLTTFLQGFMTVPEVAKRLGVCRSTVYQLCERGELRHMRVSNAIRVPLRAIVEYVGRR